MADYFPASYEKGAKRPLVLAEWLEICFVTLIKRPFVFVLISCVLGAYLGFYTSPLVRTVVISLFGLTITSVLFLKVWAAEELGVILAGIIGLSVFFCIFVIWGGQMDSSISSYYCGKAYVHSINATNEGYKNIVLKLQTDEKVILYTDNIYDYGDQITFEGVLQPIQSKGNPGDFDVRAYYRRKGISRQVSDIRIYEEKPASFSLVNFGYKIGARIRSRFYSVWQDATDDQTASILSAMVVGDESHLDNDIKNNFKQSNLAHILVVSGAHVGYFAATMGAILSFLFKEKKKMIMIALSLVFFGFVTGWGGSAARSIFTYTIIGFLSLGRRTVDRVSACSLSALIIMIIDPFAVFSWGLLLSFGATFSIMLFYHRANLLVRKVFPGFPEEIRSSVSCFLCAQIGMLPVLFLLCSTISVNSAIVVIFAGFPSEFICSFGFIFTVLSIFLPSCFRSILFVPIIGLVRILTNLADFGAMDIFGRIYLRHIPVMGLVSCVFLVLAILFRSGMKRILSQIAVICLISGLILRNWLIPCSDSYIYFLDVGQGDCALICHNDVHILIDGGNEGCGETIYKTLQYLNIPRIDIAFASHLDTDHIAGILELWSSGMVDKIYAPFWGDSIEMKQLKQSGLKIPSEVGILKGESRVVIDDDLAFEVLWPDEPVDGGNDDSMVLQCVLFDTKILFTGDITENVENRLVSKGIDDIDVLKVAHHGSRFSTSDIFLDAIKTDAAIISVGYNHYGHPSVDVLNRLESNGIPYFRTDKRGCVMLSVSETDWKIDYYFLS